MGVKVLKIIFFTGAWMHFYDGIGNDLPTNGGDYIKKYGFGGEVYNFRNSDGRNYGYVMVKGGTLDLTRINLGQKVIGDTIENVICIFVATHPKGGRRIVGWYQNARIYSDYQYYTGNDRKIMTKLEDWGDSDQVGYYAFANENTVTLLNEEERFAAPKIPNGKGGFGQSNVWYADSEIGISIRNQVIKFITEYEKNKCKEVEAEQKRRIQSEIDISAKKKVEEIAIRRTKEYYEKRGFSCKSVETDNLGWDLEFTYKNVKFLVEVKGLSQSHISVILSRNEYEKMRDNLNYYKLAVVTDCLNKSKTPPINIFSFIEEKNDWFDQNGNKLSINEIVSACCKLR